jgi:hypothetical protein
MFELAEDRTAVNIVEQRIVCITNVGEAPVIDEFVFHDISTCQLG